jgi:hypothetical protein
MRSTVLALLSFAFGCGGSSSHSVDAQVDTPVDTPKTITTIKVTTYGGNGPVNTQLVVVQDGDGPWTVVSGNAGVYTEGVHSDHLGFTLARYGDMFTSVHDLCDGLRRSSLVRRRLHRSLVPRRSAEP